MASIAMKQLRARMRASGWALVLAASLVAGGAVEAGAVLATDLRIEVISNRPDLISGGDALVEIVLPADIAPANVRVQLNGSDITSAFALRPNSRFMGLVEGMNLGDNEIAPLDDREPVEPREPVDQ